jgi:hypothetical protein
MPPVPPRRAALLALSLTLAAPVPAATAAADGRGDATVIAVIDSAFTPYHYDFLASRMPQARNRDRSDDLPLRSAPHTWLPGFPAPSAFDTYEPIRITLPTDPDETPGILAAEDADKWAEVLPSTRAAVNYYWLPGTKVIGAMTFGPTPVTRHNPQSGNRGTILGGAGSHGTGTTSVSVGNLHGTCPECLLVFIQHTDQGSAEAAIDWAMKQPWIDAISNSYGMSATYAGRDRIYNGSNTSLQRAASQRGQTIFFSAGNGQENAFTVPNSTLESSQEGPDWIVTVTATAPNGGMYSGTGKPADVAGIGTDYPSAYGATKVSGRGANGFGGTSNATPTVAGTYGRALYLARRALPGASRVQSRGLIAKGSFRCGAKRRACELAGGLTATELRFRLLQSAVSTGKGFTDGVTATVPPTPRLADAHWAAEGHGTYAARLNGTAAWLKEFDRLWKPLVGLGAPPKRPKGERDWFVVDSWCRQHIWGEWTGGYYRSGTSLPADDPSGAPARTALRHGCEGLQPPP